MPLQVFAFYNGLTEEAKGYPYLKRNGSIIHQLGVFEIPIQNNGTLLGQPSRRLINEAHAMGIKVILAVSNLTPQGKFSTVLMAVWCGIRRLLTLFGKTLGMSWSSINSMVLILIWRKQHLQTDTCLAN